MAGAVHATAEEDEPAAPHPAVQVTKDRVVAPPPRFLSCSDEALLAHFQDALAGAGGEAAAACPDQLAALFSLMEGVIQHDFLALRRRLEGDFAMFSAAGHGVAVPPAGAQHPPGRAGTRGRSAAGRRFHRLSSIEEHERRFLRDFMSAMHSAHYRLLGLMEWEAAQAEAFLFTLPVEVEWSALDKRMLQRFWGDRPDQRAVLPDLSDRILIFCRGFEPAKMRGRYLMHKVELLLSFFLLAPLWTLLTRVLQKLGLKAPPPPLIARTPQKPDITFKCAMKAAAAAVRWRRAAQGDVAGQESLRLLHDACTIIERKTMSRHFPTGRSVLSRFFDVVELQEACIRDVVVLFRRKVPKERSPPGEKEVLREGEADPAALARNIQIRQFTGIPLADLEMVMPEKKVFVPGTVFIQLVVAGVAALVGLLATFWQASLDWTVWGSALMLLGSRASQVYFQASSERNEIEREMNKLLFERTVASQEAVLHTLTDEMCRQHIRECFLCYCCLLLAGKDLSDDDLDVRCERLLRKSFDLRLDFTAEAAIPPLCEWGLVERLPGGKLRAQPLPATLVALDKVWDNAFNFDAPAAAPGSPGRAGVAASAAGAATARPASAGSSHGSASPSASPDHEGWVGQWLRSGSSRRTSFLRHGSGGRRRNSLTRRRSLDRRSLEVDGEAGEAGSTAAAPLPPAASSGGVEPLGQDFQLAAVVEEEEAYASGGEAGGSAAAVAAAAAGLPYLGELYMPSAGAALAATCPAGMGARPLPAAADDSAGAAAPSKCEAVSLQEGSAEVEQEGTADDAELGLAQGWTAQAEAAEQSVRDAGAALQGSSQLSGPAEEAPAPVTWASAAVQTEEPPCVPAEVQTDVQHSLPAAASPRWRLDISISSSSGSSLEGSPILLRVPRGAAALLRSPAASSRISPAQLRHLESLRRQRAQQEAEALECLPSALRLHRAAETDVAAGEALLRRHHRQESEPRAVLEAGDQQEGAGMEAAQTRRAVSAARGLGRRPASAGALGKARGGRCLTP
ncbi:hypothetical protein ABPG75_003159 [Micractinium tetrahymenae]